MPSSCPTFLAQNRSPHRNESVCSPTGRYSFQADSSSVENSGRSGQRLGRWDKEQIGYDSHDHQACSVRFPDMDSCTLVSNSRSGLSREGYVFDFQTSLISFLPNSELVVSARLLEPPLRSFEDPRVPIAFIFSSFLHPMESTYAFTVLRFRQRMNRSTFT